jgi:hypothetical protein
LSKVKYILIAIFVGGIFSTLNAQKLLCNISGTDKNHTVNWEFMCTGGRNSGNWTTIPLPSNWEMQGLGNKS